MPSLFNGVPSMAPQAQMMGTASPQPSAGLPGLPGMATSAPGTSTTPSTPSTPGMPVHPHVAPHIKMFLNTPEGKDVVNKVFTGMPQEKAAIMAKVKK